MRIIDLCCQILVHLKLVFLAPPEKGAFFGGALTVVCLQHNHPSHNEHEKSGGIKQVSKMKKCTFVHFHPLLLVLCCALSG